MMIKLTGMYERESAKSGLQYFTGRNNRQTRFLLLQDLQATEGAPGWTLFLAEAEDTLTPEKVAAWKASHPADKPELHLHQVGDRAPQAPAPPSKAAPPPEPIAFAALSTQLDVLLDLANAPGA